MCLLVTNAIYLSYQYLDEFEFSSCMLRKNYSCSYIILNISLYTSIFNMKCRYILDLRQIILLFQCIFTVRLYYKYQTMLMYANA